MQADDASGTAWEAKIAAAVGVDAQRDAVALRLGTWGPALALFVLGLLGLVAATLMPSGAGGQYAVIAPPWYTLPQTIGLIRQARGDITETGHAGNIVITHASGPGFVRALYRAGAWLVIDPMHVRGCAGFAPAPETTRA